MIFIIVIECIMEMVRGFKRLKVIPKNVSTDLPTTSKLSAEQLHFYRDNGFLVIKRLINFTDLNNYKQHFIEACNDKVNLGVVTVVKERSLVTKSKKREDYINKLQDIQFDDVFKTYTEHPLLLDVVAQLIGNEIMVINCMFINKPPGTSIHPPHQDLHYFPYRPADQIIGTWTAVDHAHVNNGCLWVVPGSHKANTLHEHGLLPGALKMYHGIIDESTAPLDKRVHLEMGPGDTVFFHPLLVHGSGANISKNYRKCISAHYAHTKCDCVDVHGTVQDIIAKEVEGEIKRRGVSLDFADYWRLKSKEVRGKSKL
ncbi:probable phytanoyl-CoA dioxygenase isoform X1 [Epargyreus clarus]|uniref:probable phytanoyl-CoA dioxygenase isoform X1 n=1 Tax=Epargyreus clarus TaxID=520877 RepID=UPI003C2C8237